MALSKLALSRVVRDVLPNDFASVYWSRKPCHRPGAARALSAYGYDVEAFLRDIAVAQEPPYLTARRRGDGREYAWHKTPEEMRAAVAAGGVASIKLSDFWRNGAGLAHWSWMRTLFEALRDVACVAYLNPLRSEDTDLFLAGPNSEIGAHVDATHVFTLQLFGERAWTIEQNVQLDERLRARRAPDYDRTREASLAEPSMHVVLRAGDALYVPAYAAHRVTGAGWSVALSLGLRSINEIDVVAHLLDATPRAFAEPVDTAPASRAEAHVAAKIALAKRLRALAAQLDRDAEDLVLRRREPSPPG